jgi:crotonobetainyl-CoA:carnitine CoA-transferase CaiB-like acyl-CoA transferase
MSLPSLNLDPVVRAEGYCITREHESMGPITTIGTVVKLSHTPVTPGNPASKPGADARSILADIGMAAEFDSLLNERIIVTEGVVPGGSSFGN